MKNYKREFNLFPYYDADGMVQHFEEMASEGWMLESIAEKKLFIRYRRTEPKKVKFAITYFADATVYDAGFTEDQLEYIEYCRRADWQRIESQGQIQVFCNESEDPVPLETDSVLTMEIIHDSMKRSHLMGNVMMMAVCLLQLFVKWQDFTGNFIGFISNSADMLGALIWVFLFVVHGGQIIRYYSWYRKAMSGAKKLGVILPVKNGRLWGIVSTTVSFAFILYLLLFIIDISPLIALGALVFVLLITVVSFSVPVIVKRFGMDTESNKKYSTIILVIAVTVLFFGYRKWLSGLDIQYYPDGRKPVYVIENYLEDLDFVVYKDELPLYIEDITGEKDDMDSYSCEYISKNTFIVDYKKYLQIPLPDCDLPMLRYEIVRPKGEYMYNLCLNSYMQEFDMFNDGVALENQYRYEQIDSSPWQGGTAYRLTGGYRDKSPRYIIAYEDHIIFLLTEIELTQRQQTIIATKLTKI